MHAVTVDVFDQFLNKIYNSFLHVCYSKGSTTFHSRYMYM